LGQESLEEAVTLGCSIKGAILATPNYGFEKRQKELAKKRKKEDKLKAKSDRKSGLLPEDGSDEDGQAVDTSDADNAMLSQAQPPTPAA
jgi:hypothetical protein